jgi:hypothetical protein
LGTATRQEVLRNVGHLIRRLSEPLPEDEKRNGWNEESRVIWLNFFSRLRDDLVEGRRLSKSPEYTLIYRGMDSHGIGSGVLLEEAVAISEQVYELNKSEKWWRVENLRSLLPFKKG